MTKELKEKILNHLNGLNRLESQTDSQNLVRVIANRYNVSEEVVHQVIAEWSAGKNADPDTETEDE